jgi:tetratricopeptide (TPR) repeat protein
VNILFSLAVALLLAAGPNSGERLGKAAPRKIKTKQQVQTPADVDAEYQKIVEMDDAAEKDADKWIKESEAFQKAGAGTPQSVLSAKINARFDEVRKAYEDFLSHHPKHIEARLAYGSFLNDIGEEQDAIAQWDKARHLEPKDPAAWNNLANIYAHHGPIEKAFEYYEKAMDLDPKEPVYIENLAIITYLFRKDAKARYKMTEAQVFDKSLDLYKKAMELDSKNFVLATDFAQSYYGIKPLRTEEALKAWNHALELAKTDLEKEGTYLHLARVELNSGLFDQAQKHLDLVKDSGLDELKTRLQKNLDRKKVQSDKPADPTAEDKEAELNLKPASASKK